jgi:hypothetical protein
MYLVITYLFTLVVSLSVNIAYVLRPTWVLFNRSGLSKDLLVFLINLIHLPILGILFYIILQKKSRFSYWFIILSYFVLGVIIWGITFYFNFQEGLHYPNYVYSAYHIYLDGLLSYSNIFNIGSVVVLVIVAKWHNLLSQKSSFLSPDRKSTIPTLLLALILLNIIVRIPQSLYEDFSSVTKMISVNHPMPDMPELYRQLKFITFHTPESSVIVHPDQSEEYPEIGNQVLIRYLLYPRLLVSYSKYSSFLSSTQNSSLPVFFVDTSIKHTKTPCQQCKLVSDEPSSKIYIYVESH